MPFLNGSKNENKIIRMPTLDYSPDPRGLGYVFFTNMLNYRENVAQIDGLTGERDTYGSFLQRCIRTAVTMRSKGITPSDIITTCTFNHLNSCVPYLAALFLGAKVASVDPTLSLKDTTQLLSQVTPKLIFVSPESVSHVEQVVKAIDKNVEIVVFGTTEKHSAFTDFLRPSNEEIGFKPFEIQNLRETAIIFFSSGTSGLPKGICINHFGFLSQTVNTVRFCYCQDLTLLFTSLYWVTAAIFLGSSILSGTARLIVPKFNVRTVWKTIDKYKPTFVVAAPSHLLAMYNEGRPKGTDTSSIKHIGVGGSPVLKQQLLNIKKMLPEAQILPGYGQTEVAMFITNFKASKPEELHFIDEKPTSCGTGIPGMSYKVVDPETDEILGPNRRGELRLKTEFQLNGYYNLDSSDIWDPDGWLKTGDVVYYDEDGCFYVVDRIKEMLKFQSWHVPPAAIEDVLLTHPAVATAVVIGVPHDIDGDHPAAIVVLKNSFEDVTPKEIEKYVEERVDDRKKLRGGVHIVERIPTTATGKVKRREIRNMFLQGEL